MVSSLSASLGECDLALIDETRTHCWRDDKLAFERLMARLVVLACLHVGLSKLGLGHLGDHRLGYQVWMDSFSIHCTV